MCWVTVPKCASLTMDIIIANWTLGIKRITSRGNWNPKRWYYWMFKWRVHFHYSSGRCFYRFSGKRALLPFKLLASKTSDTSSKKSSIFEGVSFVWVCCVFDATFQVHGWMEIMVTQEDFRKRVHYIHIKCFLCGNVRCFEVLVFLHAQKTRS
jgi:hypothetical protein